MFFRPKLGTFVLLLAWIPLQAQSAGPGLQPDKPVFKATARTVIVDVVVTDKHGNPVTGLKREDFTTTENGKPQSIVFFEPHTGTDAAAISTPSNQSLPQGLFTNKPVAPPTDSVSVLLLDGLNTQVGDQTKVRQQMIQYMKTIPAGRRVAIFTLSTDLRLIQGFTDDTSVLVAAINSRKSKALPTSSALLTSPQAEDLQQRNEDAMMAPLYLRGINAGASAALEEEIANLQRFEADQNTFQTDLRVQRTLAAMEALGRYLGGIPGRKNLIWFSGSFPLGFYPDFQQHSGSLDAPYRGMRDYEKDVRRTSNVLGDARVAVYPIDARGLFLSPYLDPSRYEVNSKRNQERMLTDADRLSDQTTAEHDSMEMIAEETGGVAVFNYNGLGDAMRKAIENGTNYYTLAYTPTDTRQDGKLRRIEIKTREAGHKLQYRQGYFADSPKEDRIVAQDPKSQTTFRSAMPRGVPNATELLFSQQVGAATPEQAALGKPGDNPKVKQPSKRFIVSYATNVNQLRLTPTPDGLVHGSVTVGAVAYDREGNFLNSTFNTIQLDLPPAALALLRKDGLQYAQQLDIPDGEVYLRTGMFDLESGKVGTLELPMSALTAK